MEHDADAALDDLIAGAVADDPTATPPADGPEETAAPTDPDQLALIEAQLAELAGESRSVPAEESPATTSPETPAPDGTSEIETLRGQVARLLAERDRGANAAQAQVLALRREMAAAMQQAELARMAQAWEQMDPEDRATDQRNHLVGMVLAQQQQLQQIADGQQQQQEFIAEMTARDQAIKIIAEGKRQTGPGQFAENPARKLLPNEVEILQAFQGSAWDMEKLADRFVAQRQERTEKARATLAALRQQRGADVGLAARAGQGATTTKRESSDPLGDYLETVLG